MKIKVFLIVFNIQKNINNKLFYLLNMLNIVYFTNNFKIINLKNTNIISKSILFVPRKII